MDTRIADNLCKVMERITAAAKRSGRTPDSVRLVAVTKGRSVAEMRAALAAGITDIGENRVQEAQQKYEQMHVFMDAARCTIVPVASHRALAKKQSEIGTRHVRT